jgi:formamidopyrimidine-DNA glycosylase
LISVPDVTAVVYLISMPELPEAESIARGLSGRVTGLVILRARMARRDLYRTGSRPLASLAGSRITGVGRLGKAIVFRFDPPERVLAVHLGMTGNLVYEPADSRPERQSHRHAVLHLENGARIAYFDPRRFGFFWIGSPDAIEKRLNVGPDPFSMGTQEFCRRLRRRTAPIKSLLLNQRLMSGLGNIYADEVLFHAGIHPLTPGTCVVQSAGVLLAQARAVLKRAIRHRGTTIRDFRDADGRRGGFQRRLAVYGREGEDCVRCGRPIEKTVVAARSTYFCRICQTKR